MKDAPCLSHFTFIFITVFEGKNKRHLVQDYLINKYNIFEKLLNIFKQNEESYKEKRLRLGNIGHSIIICQAINNVENINNNSHINKGVEESESRITDKEESTNTNNLCKNKTDEDEDMNALTQAISKVTIESQEENYDEAIKKSISLPYSEDDCKNIETGTNTTSETSQNSDIIEINSFTVSEQSTSITKISTGNDKLSDDTKAITTSDISSNSSSTNSELSSSALPTTDSSKLIRYFKEHSLYEEWTCFRATTLSLIIEQQTLSLGGKVLGQFGSFGSSPGKPNLLDDISEGNNDFYGVDEVGEGSLEITENEIDIAASMMGAGFSDTSPSIDSLRDLNGQMDYFYNDPLGRKSEAYLDIKGEKYQEDNFDDDDDIKDVQVIDLFVKNYDMESENTSKNNCENGDNGDSTKVVTITDDEKDAQNDKVTDDTLETKGEHLDTSWANFTDFEAVPVENISEDNSSALQLSNSQEDFFASFSEMDNAAANPSGNDDCFFDADFSSFPTPTDNKLFEQNESMMRNNNEKSILSGNSEEVGNDDDKVKAFIDFETSSQHINETESKNVVEIVDDLFVASADKSEEVDPFVDMGHRRQSIDELF